VENKKWNSAIIDITNMKFNRLTAKYIDHTNRHGTYWYCECECGGSKIVRGTNVRNGTVKSCGCLRSEIVSKNNKKENSYAAFIRILDNYRRSSIRREIKFNLDENLFLKMIQNVCYYCGREPLNVMKSQYNSGDFYYNGIDRIDNNKDYDVDNVVTCCETCNKAKLKMSEDEFLNWIKKVYDYSIMKNKNNIINRATEVIGKWIDKK
jgi:hypothetical protein